MPRIQKSTPRDIGNPAKARIDTVKWLKGEGPPPEQFNILLPDDEEALDRYRKGLWLHPERAAMPGKSVHQFIAEAGAAEKGLLKSEHNQRQRATRDQTQQAALRGVRVRQEDSEKWRDFARTVHDRGGDETHLQMANRIRDELLNASWVEKADWKNISKTERRDPDTGYVPSIDVIVRFLRTLTKNQQQ